MKYQDRQGCNSFTALWVGAVVIAGVVAIFVRAMGLWGYLFD
jgi:hypothetical protein